MEYPHRNLLFGFCNYKVHFLEMDICIAVNTHVFEDKSGLAAFKAARTAAAPLPLPAPII